MPPKSPVARFLSAGLAIIGLASITELISHRACGVCGLDLSCRCGCRCERRRIRPQKCRTNKAAKQACQFQKTKTMLSTLVLEAPTERKIWAWPDQTCWTGFVLSLSHFVSVPLDCSKLADRSFDGRGLLLAANSGKLIIATAGYDF